MIEFLLGFMSAAALFGVIKLIRGHKHDYDVLFHRQVKTLCMSYGWEKYMSDSYDFSPDENCIYATYKKCKICNDVVVSLGSGSTRDFYFNYEQLKDKIEAIMKIEQKAEDEKLLKSVDAKLDEKYNTPQVLQNQKEMVLNNA